MDVGVVHLSLRGSLHGDRTGLIVVNVVVAAGSAPVGVGPHLVLPQEKALDGVAVRVGAGIKVIPALPHVHQLPVVVALAPRPLQVQIGDFRHGEQGLGDGEVGEAVPPLPGHAVDRLLQPVGLVGVAHVPDAAVHIVEDGPGLFLPGHVRGEDPVQDFSGLLLHPGQMLRVLRAVRVGEMGLLHHHVYGDGGLGGIALGVSGGVHRRVGALPGEIHLGGVHLEGHRPLHLVLRLHPLPVGGGAVEGDGDVLHPGEHRPLLVPGTDQQGGGGLGALTGIDQAVGAGGKGVLHRTGLIQHLCGDLQLLRGPLISGGPDPLQNGGGDVLIRKNLHLGGYSFYHRRGPVVCTHIPHQRTTGHSPQNQKEDERARKASGSVFHVDSPPSSGRSLPEDASCCSRSAS